MTLPHLFWPVPHAAKTTPAQHPVLALGDLFHTLTEGFYVSEQHLEHMLDRIERPMRVLP